MSIITFNYAAKKIVKPDPVAESDIEETSSSDNNCETSAEIIIKPGPSSKYVTVDITGTASAFCSIANGTTVTSNTNVLMIIDAFKSSQDSQNNNTSTITLRVYTSNGGALENTYRIRRGHTDNIC